MTPLLSYQLTPDAPVVGQAIGAQLLHNTAAALRSLRIIAGPGIRLAWTPNGVVLSAVRSSERSSYQTGAASDCIVGRVRSHVGNVYTVAIPRDGKEDLTVQAASLELSGGAELPAGTLVLLHPLALRRYLESTDLE